MKLRLEKILVCLGIFLFVFAVRGQSDNGKEFHVVMSATDERGRFAGGLTVKDVALTVDKKPQEITSFTPDGEPATIVFLIDLSGSQKGSVAPAAKEIGRFVRNANPNNEYIILAFNTKIQLVADKTTDLKAVEDAINKTAATVPRGNTAFYDSVYAAIDKAESGKYAKKILILCGDGVDNVSVSYKESDVFNSLKRNDVLFYSVSYTNERDNSFLKNMLGGALLTEVGEISGGKSYFPLNETELSGVFDRIALELKSQYRIGFRFADAAKPDKWRGIKIKVAPVADGNKKIKVQARTRGGFYPAPVQ